MATKRMYYWLCMNIDKGKVQNIKFGIKEIHFGPPYQAIDWGFLDYCHNKMNLCVIK